MADSDINIALLEPGDWREYRQIRLEALRREPNAFSSTYAEALTRSDDAWRERLALPRSLLLVARAAGRPVGTVGAFLGTDEGDTSVAVVNGMYVDAGFRRRGMGAALLRDVMARIAGHPEVGLVRLWVNLTEEPAVRLYQSLGFQIVARGDADREQVIMERPLHPDHLL